MVEHSSSARPTVVGDEARLQSARLGLQALLLLMSSEVADARRGAGAGGDDADVIKAVEVPSEVPTKIPSVFPEARTELGVRPSLSLVTPRSVCSHQEQDSALGCYS